MRALGSFLKDVWHLARPYFRSEEKFSAWLLLVSIIALNLSLVGMNVVLSFWNREFFNALQAKDSDAFFDLLFLYRRTESGLMPGFCEVAVVYILFAIYRTWLNQWLQIRWRRWLTTRYLDEWLADRAYYRISLTTDHAAVGTDNPDQRIAEDLREFVDSTLSLGLGLMRQVVTLVSFTSILWGLSGALTLFGVSIPGYMVWIALAYAVLGTWLTHLVGRPLSSLRFRQQRVEADFRYALVRLRENMEGVALYGGEAEEKGNLTARFGNVIGNWWAIMQRTKLLNMLVVAYDEVAVVFPIIVAAPRYFSGQLPLGGLTQTAGAFGRVQGALSWFVTAYASLAEWRATVERLTGFHRAIVAARAAAGQGMTGETSTDGSLALHGLTLTLPDGTKLTENENLVLPAGRSVVVTGRSGSGKSTLFRAIAGIWPFGSGRITRPTGKILFLPQRPYIPLGALRYVVAYPDTPDMHDRADIAAALTDAGLAHLVPQLNDDENWAQRLSGGEQQRIALARALLAKPDWLFMDEATASLDVEAEEALYATLRAKLPRCTIVSIAHRPTVAAFHDAHLTMTREPHHPGRLRLTEVS